jgi:16S rRNA pseudouridine516 synthase
MLKLEKLLARNLPCSRAQARRVLAAEPGPALPAEVLPSALPLHVQLAGRRIDLYDAYHVMLHKPVGYVTALSDAQYATAASLVANAPLAPELRAVGRLDRDTSGLLLWTTDGAWLHRLTNPRTGIPRVYHAALARPYQALPPELVLRDGHRPRILDLQPLAAADAHSALCRHPEAVVFAAITIAGGAYHEVRRIFAALGSHVLALCRVSFGALVMPADLAPGQWRPIDQAEVEK